MIFSVRQPLQKQKEENFNSQNTLSKLPVTQRPFRSDHQNSNLAFSDRRFESTAIHLKRLWLNIIRRVAIPRTTLHRDPVPCGPPTLDATPEQILLGVQKDQDPSSARVFNNGLVLVAVLFVIKRQIQHGIVCTILDERRQIRLDVRLRLLQVPGVLVARKVDAIQAVPVTDKLVGGEAHKAGQLGSDRLGQGAFASALPPRERSADKRVL